MVVVELEADRQRAAALIASTTRDAACEAAYERVFAAFPSHHGKRVSRRARDELRLTAPSLVYGEIEFASFFETLDKIKRTYGVAYGVMQEPNVDVFYDLGSGAGKPCVAAACCFEFKKCVGVECLQALVDASREVADVFRTQNPAGPALVFHAADCTDLTKHDWTLEATVVFANSTCFDDHLMAEVADRANSLKPGAFVVTLTKRLPSPRFYLCDTQLYQMSWGGATVFIQRKLHDHSPPSLDQ